MRLTAVTLLLLAAACGSPETPAPQAGAAPASKETYWKKAFPTAAKFERRGIAKDALIEADYGNNVFVEVSDAQGNRLGYLRDFVGPVATEGTCACDPINVTLVFDAAGKFSTLISPQPLTKHEHVAMTPEETQRLIGILRDPPNALLEVRNQEELVDATTGATKPPYKPFVIDKAALETKRLVQLVIDTSLIIAAAPIADDQKHLSAALQKPEGIERARALADLIGRLTADMMAQRAYVVMSHDYLAAVMKSQTIDETIDAKILDSALADRVGPGMQAEICYRLAEQKAALSVAERCAKALARYQDAGPIVALIDGTVAYFRGDNELAAKALESASWRFDIQQDPMVHTRLAAALVATGKTEAGCAKALLVRRAHPLLPDNKTTLDKCGKSEKGFAAKLTASEKEDRELFLGLKQAGAQVPTIEVDDNKLQPVKLAAGEPGKVTVMMFFATWCPHCQAELPKISAFADRIQKDKALASKVRVIGVRTAIERETETYEAFQQRFKISFPVYTDTAMSTSYSKVVNDAGLKGGFPTLLVTDETGKLRYEMPAGEWRDTDKELEWAVKSLAK
ncbi:MAG: TlpA family protein disulfide reductase [Myxococcota bacterium]